MRPAFAVAETARRALPTSLKAVEAFSRVEHELIRCNFVLQVKEFLDASKLNTDKNAGSLAHT